VDSSFVSAGNFESEKNLISDGFGRTKHSLFEGWNPAILYIDNPNIFQTDNFLNLELATTVSVY
jgi:hypothetical protein